MDRTDVGAGVIGEADVAGLMEKYGVKPPEEIQFPTTFKLDEKYALHFDRRGLVLRDGRYQPAISWVVTKNQVVQLERGQ